MKTVAEILGGVFLLILVYLFLWRGKETVALVNAIAGNAIEGIRTLQGRG